MTFTRYFTPVAVAAALAVAATPAAAQHRGSSRGAAVSHSQSRGTAVVRSSHPVYSTRGISPRVVVAPRGIASNRVFVSGRYYRPSYRSVYRPVYYSRPYYSFRPHFSLGIGLSIGYPFAWSDYYGYYSPYAYPAYGPPAYYPPTYYPPAYPSSSYPSSSYPSSSYPAYPPDNGYGGYSQPPANSTTVQPQTAPPDNSNTETGGVSIEVSPSSASVFVDGTYMGRASEFGETAQPLGLATGRHHIEIRAEGYKTMTFDANVVTGQVTPFRATLQR
jgi:hypothetical protein